MKTILFFILSFALTFNAIAGYEKGDTERLYHDADRSYYGLVTEKGILPASMGCVVTSEEYDAIKAKTIDEATDYDKQLDYLTKAVIDILIEKLNEVRENAGMEKMTEAELRVDVKEKVSVANMERTK